MISPDEFDALAARLVGGAEERYIATLIEQLVATFASGGSLNSWTWRDINQMAQTNHQKLNDLAIRFRTSIARETEEAVSDALKASAADDAMALASLYGPAVKMAGVTKLYERVSAQTVEGVQSIIARQNIALAESAERLWYEVASDAVTAWDHGVAPMDTIIRRSVERLSREGLSVVDYKSGQRTSVDAAIRRHAVSQIGQASGRITMGYMTELGHDLVFTSAHMGARPEHEVWQGKAFSLSGAKVKDGVFYPDFYRATGYGTVTGLLGVNCRHSFGVHIPGITSLPELPDTIHGMSSSEFYDQTQKQRGYEREIRRLKKDIALGEKSGLDMTQKRLELGRKQSQLKAHCDKNKLVRQYQREKAYAIGAQPRALRKERLLFPDANGNSYSMPKSWYQEHILNHDDTDSLRKKITSQMIAETIANPDIIALNPASHPSNPLGKNFYRLYNDRLAGKYLRVVTRDSDMTVRTAMPVRRLPKKSIAYRKDVPNGT